MSAVSDIDEIIRKLQAAVVTLEGLVTKLLAGIADLEQRVREPEAQFKQNSCRPPSSDPPHAP